MAAVGRGTPDDYQPALGWWGTTWRLLGMLAISAVVLVGVADTWSDLRFVVDVGCGLVAYVLVWFRRRRPVPVAVVLLLLAAVSTTAAGPVTLASVSVATRRRWREVALLAVLNVASAEALTVVQPQTTPQPWWLDLTLTVVVTSAILAWGMYIGSRRELLWQLRDRAERAEAENELRASRSRLEERSRIAREMHDVLAHRISQISMRAGALTYRDDLDQAEMRREAGVIRASAHQALTDLRAVLGVLRDESGETLHRPQPTYTDLRDLLAGAREGGQRVVLDEGLPDDVPLPETTGRTVYRIVQEGLTNAAKHAPGSELRVEVAGGPDDGVRVRLRNPTGFARSATPGSGLGLVGLAERAALAGGRLGHDDRGDEFVVEAWLPWVA